MTSWLGRQGYLPHGFCFDWDPGVLWTMVGADSAVALAYYSIPAAMLVFMRRRRDLPFSWAALLFVAFIFACGTTHVMDVWTIWVPDYRLQLVTKVVTAVVSVGTAVALWPLLPKLLALPSSAELQATIAQLETEIAERRRAETALLHSRGGLTVALAGIGAGHLSLDADGRIRELNSAAAEITGWPAEAAIGRPLREVWDRVGLSADEAAMDVMAFIQARQHLLGRRHPLKIRARDGRIKPVELSVAQVLDETGGVRGAALVFTDRSKAMLALESQSRLSAIVESSSDAIIGKSLDDTVTTWNHGAEQLFGHTADEIVGQPGVRLMPAHLFDAERDLLQRVAGGQRVPAFDTQRLHKDGRLLEVSLSLSPVVDERGKVIGTSKIVRDASARRAAEEARAESQRLAIENRQIMAANQLKNAFMANMSHELRTPLNAIIGFAELLSTPGMVTDETKRQEFQGHIAVAGNHLLRLINDVLDLAKVEAGKFEFYPEPVVLQRLLDDVVQSLSATAARASVSLQVEVDASLTDIAADVARLRQMLYNYLSNAIKFSPAGGMVSLRAMPVDADHYRLEVEDRGIGIRGEDLPRLFVEFQQLDSGPNKRHQGTGLGLALTRRLAEAQGGLVGVRSEPGRGSVFHLVLLRKGRPLPSSAAPRPAPLLLLVDPDSDHQQRRARRMAAAGFEVQATAEPDTAVAAAQQRAFDAVALHLSPADGDALDLLRRIRAGEHNRDVPVVLLSLGSGGEASADYVVGDVLPKPAVASDVERLLTQTRVAALGGGSRVLLVDDDPRALEMMSQAMRQAGFVPLPVTGGREALDRFEALRPDAVILDLMMPGIDGFQVLEALQHLPGGAEVPVFVWTGLSLSPQDRARLARTAQAIIGKGEASLEQLTRRLRRLVGQAQASEESPV